MLRAPLVLIVATLVSGCAKKPDDRTTKATEPQRAAVKRAASEPPASPAPVDLGRDGVGPFHIGMDINQAGTVAGFLVSKTKRKSGREGHSDDVLAVAQAGEELFVLRFDAGRLITIEVSSPRVKTREGIGLGSTASEVERAYGQPFDELTEEGETCAQFEKTRGLMFCIRSQARGWAGAVRANAPVTTILVVEQSPDGDELVTQ